MSQIVIYPRLYTTRRPIGNGIELSRGDATIEALFKFHSTNEINTTTWTFRKEVLDSAIRLFGNVDEWMQDQLRNPRIVGYNLDFIKDSLEYTRTGRRSLSTSNWIELVNEAEDGYRTAENTKVAPLSAALNRGEATIQFIQNWCSQPGGIEDLLWSLHILFGNAKPQRK